MSNIPLEKVILVLCPAMLRFGKRKSGRANTVFSPPSFRPSHTISLREMAKTVARHRFGLIVWTAVCITNIQTSREKNTSFCECPADPWKVVFQRSTSAQLFLHRAKLSSLSVSSRALFPPPAWRPHRCLLWPCFLSTPIATSLALNPGVTPCLY